MSYTINEQRNETMLKRIGVAAELVDDKRYLPFYRSIQILLEKLGKPEEWLKMVELAKTKDTPSKYFAQLCKRVRNGTYQFIEKVQEVTGAAALWIDDKLVRFGFGKYQGYWRRKAQEFININGQAGLVELLEYADRKGVSQKYMAASLKNCKPPRKYYTENIKPLKERTA